MLLFIWMKYIECPTNEIKSYQILDDCNLLIVINTPANHQVPIISDT